MDEQIQSQSNTETNTAISPIVLSHLKAITPWLKFIAIVGMVLCGFLVLGGLGMMNMMSYGGFIFVVYLVIAVVIFFPQLFLLQYANNLRSYIATNNTALLEKAFEKQKSYWTYIGVLLIIYLAIMVLLLLVFAFAGATIFSIMKHSNPYMQQ